MKVLQRLKKVETRFDFIGAVKVAVKGLLIAGSFMIGLMSGLYAQLSADTVLTRQQLDQIQQKAEKWVKEAGVTDPGLAAKAAGFIEQHLKAVYGWNKSHTAQEVPAGINPRTGEKLTELDRKMIVQSAMPASVHRDLMDSLNRNLSAEQVEKILDGYTIGKVAFTLKGYQAIVSDLNAEETAVILSNLKQAREEAIDYKSMKSISAIFEIYKTKNEKYLNEHGRNWHQLFGDYVKKVQAEKKAKAAAKKNKEN